MYKKYLNNKELEKSFIDYAEFTGLSLNVGEYDTHWKVVSEAFQTSFYLKNNLVDPSVPKTMAKKLLAEQDQFNEELKNLEKLDEELYLDDL